MEAHQQIKDQIARAKAFNDIYMGSRDEAEKASARRELGAAFRAAMEGVIYAMEKDGWPIDVDESVKMVRAIRDGEVLWTMAHNGLDAVEYHAPRGYQTRLEMAFDMSNQGYPIAVNPAFEKHRKECLYRVWCMNTDS